MEAQIDYIARAVDLLLTRDLHSLEVDRHNSGCRSWYLTEDGFNATMYPGFGTQYMRQLARLDLDDWIVTPRANTPAVTGAALSSLG
ncbi:putative flavoprotein involved in K+ transport [Mycobacteroides abscessus subsp. abscessus]|nr:putative flavoprotein involved in K+ transport [Mycobacteroides abscessus subsp. abscessus]